MKIKFWGTRGSVPAAGPDTVKYGGNTTCLEIRLDDGELIVLDAGTGIRKLGAKLLDELAQRPAGQNYSAHLIFTHFHWDHIQGFPFFRPVFSDRFSFKIYSRLEKTSDVRQTLADQIRAPYLPFLFEHLRANLDFVPTGREPFTIGRTKIHSIATNHPNNAIGYKMIEGGKTFVFLTDNELYMDKKVTPYEDFVGFCAGADLLVHDAQWDDEEAKKFPAWGHSSYSQVVELAVKAKVKCVGFTHHDPYHPDSWIDRMVAQTQKLIKRNKIRIRCFAASEGLTRKL